MSDKFGPQLLPDDEVPASVWYCKSFGPDYEYEAASHSVVSDIWPCSALDMTI